MFKKNTKAATAVTKMAERVAAFLKNIWAKELVLVASFAIVGLAVILSTLSAYTKYPLMIHRATSCNYPVPLQDDGNMPHVPSHPQDPQGPSLKKLWAPQLTGSGLRPDGPNKCVKTKKKKKERKKNTKRKYIWKFSQNYGKPINFSKK